MLHCIVVALDGSPESEQILPQVERLAGPETTIHLLHIVQEQRRAGAHHAVLTEEEAEQYLRGIATRCAKHAVFIHLGIGTPGTEIPAIAARLGADIIAMTTHARSGLSHLLLGSVAEAVVRSTSVPVFLTRPGLSQPLRPVKRILVAVDGSNESRGVCETVRRVIGDVGSELILLQVVVPIVVGDPMTGYVPIGVPELLPDPAPALQEWSHQLSSEGIKAIAVVAFGDAPMQILDHARRLDVDLIAMRTAGRKGLARLFMGSVAEKVVRHMDRPVLLDRVAPRPEAVPTDLGVRIRDT